MRYFLVFLALAGCATPYQSSGYTGGYSDTKEAPGVYVVQVRGNGYTNSQQLQGYAQRRGLELCRAEGYPHARIAGRDQAEHSQTGATYTAETQRYGNSATTTVRENPGYTITKHVITARVVCVTQQEFDEHQANARQRALQQMGE